MSKCACVCVANDTSQRAFVNMCMHHCEYPTGLHLPVVAGADTTGLFGISQSVKELVAKVEDGSIASEDVQVKLRMHLRASRAHLKQIMRCGAAPHGHPIHSEKHVHHTRMPPIRCTTTHQRPSCSARLHIFFSSIFYLMFSMKGGTFSMTNLGMFGVKTASAVINSPQVTESHPLAHQFRASILNHLSA